MTLPDGGGPDARREAACVDTTPPSRPGRPELTLGAAGVQLTWSASSGALTYRVFRDGR